MNRRELLSAGGLALMGGGAVGTTLGNSPVTSNPSSQPAYIGQAPTVYERDQLQLNARQEVVRHGDTITYEITHTGQSNDIVLGCGNHGRSSPMKTASGTTLCGSLVDTTTHVQPLSVLVTRRLKQSPCRGRHWLNIVTSVRSIPSSHRGSIDSS